MCAERRVFEISYTLRVNFLGLLLTNYCKLGGSKQYTFIFSLLGKQKSKLTFTELRSSLVLEPQEVLVECLFFTFFLHLPVTADILGLMAPSLQSWPSYWHCFHSCGQISLGIYLIKID